MRTWAEVSQSPEFQALDYDAQESARRQYWDDVVAPQIPKEDRLSALTQFNKDTRIPEPYSAGKFVVDIGQAISDIPTHALSSLAGSIEGSDPYTNDNILDSLRKKSEDLLTERQAQPESQDPAIMGMTRGEVKGIGRSLGYTASGAVTGIGAAALGSPGGPAASWAAAGAAMTAAMQRTTANDFVRMAVESADEDRKQKGQPPMTRDERIDMQAKLNDLANEYGWWEALPEVAGQLGGLKIITAPIKQFLGKNIVGRVLAKASSLYGLEFTQETVTQTGQHNVEVQAGLTEGEKRDFGKLSDVYDSFLEIAPPVAIQTALTAGAASGAHKVYRYFKEGKEPPEGEATGKKYPVHPVAPDVPRETSSNLSQEGSVATTQDRTGFYPFPNEPEAPSTEGMKQLPLTPEELDRIYTARDEQAERRKVMEERLAYQQKDLQPIPQEYLDKTTIRRAPEILARLEAAQQERTNRRYVDQPKPLNTAMADALGAIKSRIETKQAPLTPQERMRQASRLVPETDDILAAIAKLGGLSRSEAEAQGIDPAELNRTGWRIRRVFTKGGKTFDGMAEALHQYGYPVTDEGGKYTANALLDSIGRALSGEHFATPEGVIGRAETKAEDLEFDNAVADELDSLATELGDSLTPDQFVETQDYIEARLDAEKVFGQDAVDDMVERIAIENESIPQDQFTSIATQALREAVNAQQASEVTPASPARERSSGPRQEETRSQERSLKGALKERAIQEPKEPTEAQIEAGNYPKDHERLHGIDITIENKAGSTRKWTNRQGESGEQIMQHDYGYVRGTVGKDGDQVDIFIGDRSIPKAFVVDQIDPSTGAFDEHKILLGFPSKLAARQAYQRNYQKGWKGLKSITEMSIDELKDWLSKGVLKQEVSKEAGHAKEVRSDAGQVHGGRNVGEGGKGKGRSDIQRGEGSAPSSGNESRSQEGREGASEGLSRDELLSELTKIRSRKPRPLNKMFGSNPTPEQIEKHKNLMREWSREHGRVNRAFKKAEETINKEGSNKPFSEIISDSAKKYPSKDKYESYLRGRLGRGEVMRNQEKIEKAWNDAHSPVVKQGEPEYRPADITQTKAFKDWFGNSKIVDEDGNPLVVYHGTPSRPSESNNKYVREEGIIDGDKEYPVFDKFDFRYMGITDSGWLGSGAYFTPDPDYAHEFGDRIIPVYLSINNPFKIYDDNSTGRSNIFRFIKSIQHLSGIPEEYKLDLSIPESQEYIDYKGEESTLNYWISHHEDTDGVLKYHLVSGRDKSSGGVIEGSGETAEEAIFAYRYRYNDKYIGFVFNIIKNIGNAEFTRILKSNGYDGLIEYRQRYKSLGETGNDWKIQEVLAYDPAQIKSAIGNRGTFSKDDPNILMQREADYAPDLFIYHNTTEQKIRNMRKIGGLAVPSLAISRKGQHHSGFGDITLIGPREMADPKGYARTKVYGSDIYSPRYPTVEYKFTDAAVKGLSDRLNKYIEYTDYQDRTYIDLDSLNRDGSKYLMSDARFLAGFAVEHNIEFPEKAPSYKITQAIEEAGLYPDMEAEAHQTIIDMKPEERIFRGYTNAGRRRYIPHTLENVVNILKKDLRGGENFNYGVGSLRAMFTPQFKSLAQIRKEKGRLVSEEDFKRVKNEIDQEFFALADDLKPYYEYDTGWLGYYDTVVDMLAESVKLGFARSAKEYGFNDVSDETKGQVYDFLNKLRSLPTEYFEAKIVRDVDIAEFSAAAVPEGTSKEVIDYLKSRGVEVETYKKGKDNSDRERAINDLAIRNQAILFQKEGKYFAGPNPIYSALSRAFYNAKQESMPATQWRMWLNANKAKLGVKDEEIEWTGILDWLGLQSGKVARSDIQNFLARNGVQVEKVELGGQPETIIDVNVGVWEEDEPDSSFFDDQANDKIEEVKQRMADEQDIPVSEVDAGEAFNVAREEVERDYYEDPDRGVIKKIFVSADVGGEVKEFYFVASSRYGDFEIFAPANQGNELDQFGGEAVFSTSNRRDFPDGPRIESIVKDYLKQKLNISEDVDEDTAPQFSSWTLPGGENYRELLFKLPRKTTEYGKYIKEDPGSARPWKVYVEGEDIHQTSFETKRAAEEFIKNDPTWTTVESHLFSGDHWKEGNVLGHIRVKDRDDKKGRKIYFIEEFQSDWAEQGRDQGFFPGSEAIKELQDQEIAANHATVDYLRSIVSPQDILDAAKAQGFNVDNMLSDDVDGKILIYAAEREGAIGSHELDYIERGEFNRLWAISTDLAKKIRDSESNLSKGPFVTKTESWVSLLIKQAIKDAIDGGYDAIAWATGDQQNERYSLEKHITSLRWSNYEDGIGRLQAYSDAGSRNVLDQVIKEEDIKNYVGVEVANRLIASEEKQQSMYVQGDKVNVVFKELSGVDLKTGGDAMREFYDVMVPQFANKILKKLGSKTSYVQIKMPNHGKASLALGGTKDLVPVETSDPQQIVDMMRSGEEIYYGSQAEYGINFNQIDSNVSADILYNFVVRVNGFRGFYRASLPKDSYNAIELTPKLIQSVQGQGMPLFQKEQAYKVDNEYGLPVREDFDQTLFNKAKKDLAGIELWAQKPGRSVLGSAIPAQFKKHGVVDLIGQEIKNTNDLAVAAQIYRNPNFETFRFIFVKNDRVVGYTGATSRLPGITLAFPVGKNGFDQSESIARIREMMQSLGADGYYMLHNHPSGDPTPSQEDIRTTSKIGGLIKGFKGHVVINSGKYAEIRHTGVNNFDGTIDVADYVYPLEGVETYKMDDPVKPHPLLHRSLLSAGEVANFAKQLELRKGFVTLIGTFGTRASVRGIMEVSTADLEHKLRAMAIIRGFGRMTGSSRIFLAGVPKSAADQVKDAIRWNLVMDAVYEDGSTERTVFHNTVNNAFSGRKLTAVVAEPEAEYETQDGEFFSRSARSRVRNGAGIIQKAKDALGVIAGNDDAARNISSELTEEFNAWDKWAGTLDNLVRKNLESEHVSPQNKQSIRRWFEAAKALQMDKDSILAGTNEAVVAFNSVGSPGIKKLSPAYSDQQKKLSDALFQGTLRNKSWSNADLRNLFGLTPDGITAYRKIRKYFDDSTQEYKRRLIERLGFDQREQEEIEIETVSGVPDADIERMHGKKGLVAARMIRDFRSLEGYFPLMRYGRYTVSVYRGDELVHFEMAESKASQASAVTRLRDEFDSSHKISYGRIEAHTGDNMTLDPRVMSMLKEYAEQAEEAGVKDFVDEVEQKMLKSFAERSFRKRFIHRKGTPGYSEDIVRAIASYGWSSSNYLSKLRYIPILQQLRENIDRHELPQVREHFNREIDYLKNPTGEFAGFKSFTFAMYMGLNVKSAIVNLSQIPITLYPYLANKYSDASAMGAIQKAWRKTMTRKDTGDEKLDRLLKWAEQEGITMDQYLSELIGAAQGKRAASSRLRSRVLESITFMFGAAEKWNRRTAVAALYYLERGNFSDKAWANGQIPKAIQDKVIKVVQKTQFDYGKFNRPRAFRGIGGIPLQFQQFMINYIQFLAGNGGGKGAAIRSLSVLFVLAGAMGLPGADDIKALIEFLIQKIGNTRIDIELEARKGLVEATKGFFGDRGARIAAEWALRGHGAVLPWDITGSISAGRVVPGFQTFFERAASDGVRDATLEAATEALGPGFGLARRAAKGIEEYAVSGDLARLPEAVIPNIAIRNAFHALRLAEQGVERDYAGRVKIAFQPSAIDILGQALSFQPSVRSQLYRIKGAEYQEAQFLKRAHESLIVPLAVAIAERDNVARRKAMLAIMAWNSEAPVEWRLPMSKVQESIKRRAKQFEIGKKTGLGSDIKQLRAKFEKDRGYFPVE